MSTSTAVSTAPQSVDLEGAAFQELNTRLQLRLLRDQNLKAHQGGRPDISHFRSLSSTIAKCSAFTKKCAKLGSDSLDSLVKELRSLNLNKYVSEVASSIASAPLRPTDLDAAVVVCSELHQLYADFSQELSQCLLRLISPSSKTDLAQRRVALRLFTELFIAGVFTDQAALTSMVKETLDTKDAKQLPLTLQLTLSFVRSGGRDILGLIPVSMEPKLAQYKQAGLLKVSDKLEESLRAAAYESILEGVIAPEKRTIYLNFITSLFQKMSSIFLQSHKKLREVEQKNQDLLVTRHEIPVEASAAYAKQLEQFENFQRTLASLSDMLHLVMPNLPQQDKVTRMKETKSSSSTGNGNDDAEDQGPWESEEAKRFYETIPELRAFLPASLLSLDSTKSGNSSNASYPASATTNDSVTPSTSAENAIGTAFSTSLPSDASSSVATTPRLNATTTSTSSATSSSDSSKAATGASESTPDVLVNFFEKLMRCSNRQLIDDAAMEFVRLNQKSWRVKLAILMHSAPRNRLDTLRYFSRFVAILHPYFKDIGSTLVKRLEEEFLFLFRQKDQTNSPSKLWNARFLGELTKFKICPPNTVLTFLKQCLDDFIGYNVYVACELVETCGRYLLNLPETRVLTSNLLDQMSSLKVSKHFHVTMEILIDNALQTARPVERVVKAVEPLPPIQQYIQKLLFLDLRRDTLAFVVTQLRKLPWPEQEAFLLKSMLKVYKNKYQHIALVASVVSQLSQIHLQFGVKFLDHLLELVRVDLEERKFNNHQKLVMNVTLVGELINHKLADAKLFYKMLYSIIRYNTITFPKSGPTDFSFKPISTSDANATAAAANFNNARATATTPSIKEQQRDHAMNTHMAWVEDSFRIRLVCTLLTTCRSIASFSSFNDSQTGRTQARDLESFLIYFQRFLFLQRHITPELHSLLDDTWYIVRPPHLFRTPEELEAKIAVLRLSRPSFDDIDERLSLPYKITSSNAQDALADDDEEDTRVDETETSVSHLEPVESSSNASNSSANDTSPSSGDKDADGKPKGASDVNKQQEDELTKMFDSMLQDSLNVRTNVNTRANNSIFSVPLMALKRKAEVIKQAAKEELVIPAIERSANSSHRVPTPSSLSSTSSKGAASSYSSASLSATDSSTSATASSSSLATSKASSTSKTSVATPATVSTSDASMVEEDDDGEVFDEGIEEEEDEEDDDEEFEEDEEIEEGEDQEMEEDDEDEDEDGEDDDASEDDDDEEEVDEDVAVLASGASSGASSARNRAMVKPAAAPAMTFQFLARKPGNKPVIGSIDLPADSAMVKRHLHTQEVAQIQKEALQAVTMKLHRMGEEAEAKREDAPIQSLGYHSARPAPRAVQPTTYAAAVEALSTSVPKKSFSPQLDPPTVVARPPRNPKK